MILLDCTLRDGGYYNNWDFTPSLINDYFSAMSETGVHYVEVGLRSFQKKPYKGPCAYSTDRFLAKLTVPKKLKLGVMVNASELIAHSGGINKAVNLLFQNSEQSPAQLVRIACHYHEIKDTLNAANLLKAKGYTVGVNLMQIAERSQIEISQAAKEASNSDIDVLYFADSMGSLQPYQISEIISTIRTHWKKDIGIHAHDNLGLAIQNTLHAKEQGATWLDATVTGMGRGPGNAQTEYLSIYLINKKVLTGDIQKLLQLVEAEFKPMKAHYQWGTNPYYYLAGLYSIHPTYVQQMLSDTRFTSTDIYAVLEQLKLSGGNKYNEHKLQSARHITTKIYHGQWSPASRFKDREILIVGSGPSIRNHKEAIEDYIKANKPIVLAVNAHCCLNENLIDYRIASHPVRILADIKNYASLPQPLIIPAANFSHQVLEQFGQKQILDFGLQVLANNFAFGKTEGTSSSSLVMAYALTVATSGQAAKIYLAGMDGYDYGDQRRIEGDEIFHCYSATEGSLPIESITPTKFDIPSTSVYAYL